MQNITVQCKRHGEDFILPLCVTYSFFGNRMVNGLVTEQPQYSALFCIFAAKQNSTLMLISNELRLAFYRLLIVAEWCILHIARHTFASLAIANKVSLESIAKMLGHTDIRTTRIYAKIMNSTIANEMKVLQNKFAI